MNEALGELERNVPSRVRSENIAGTYLIYVFNNIANRERVRIVRLRRTTADQYLDYPDKEGVWQTDDPRCQAFDEDDKKWVALAAKFRRETGINAPITNAGDRCWMAFELILSFSGISLEFLCPLHSSAS